MLFGIIKNLVIVFVLIGALYMVTQLSPQIKKQADMQIAKVLGTKTTPKDTSKPLPDSLKEDATEQLDDAKDKAMHITLTDVAATVNRLQKVPKDLTAVKENVEDQVRGMFKK